MDIGAINEVYKTLQYYHRKTIKTHEILGRRWLQLFKDENAEGVTPERIATLKMSRQFVEGQQHETGVNADRFLVLIRYMEREFDLPRYDVGTN